MKITTMSEAIEYLQQYIAPPPHVFQAERGLKRMELLMKLLDNPQDKIKVIHVAGTSGKGSTCYFITHLLHTAGHTVGLTVSPHIRDIKERIQINNKLISEEEFCAYLKKIIPSIDQMKDMEFGAPTYFEIIMALAFFVFKEKNVEYAVIETGMGGQFDASNVIHNENKVAVITRIGLDHTKILGNTLSKIALQKAKIIQKHNAVFSIHQRSHVQNVIQKEAESKDTNVTFLVKNKSYKNIRIREHAVMFNFNGGEKFSDLSLENLAIYQVENASLALEVVLFLSKRDKFIFDEKILRKALKTTLIPGRMEMFMMKDKPVIIDGAHNPQKMRAFLQSLVKLFPHTQFDFLIAFKKDKDIKPMVKMIIPYAETITVTSFFVNDTMLNISAKPEDVSRTLMKFGFKKSLSISDPVGALKKTVASSKSIVVVTGSMYLVGELYKEITELS